VLYDFLPAGEIFEVAEAVIRVFHRLGDFKHKQRNRMKFLIRELGWDAWRGEVMSALSAVRAEGAPRLPFDPENPPEESAPDWTPPAPPSVADTAARAGEAVLRGPGLIPEFRRALPVRSDDCERWARSNVRPQRQAGYVLATVTVPLGDLTAAQLRILGELALAFGDGTVRTTPDQNLVFRWVRAGDVLELHRRLAAADLARPGAGSLADVTSCPGAESCKLAVTQSRGLGRLLTDHLSARPELGLALPGVNIKISGCPNGCGQHHIAGIGFQGSVRRLGDRVIPQYFVMLGGGVDTAGARFGRLAAKLPARRVPQAIERLAALYTAEAEPGENATTFFRRVELDEVKTLLSDLERLTPEDALPADFVDLGESSEFKVEAMEGECSA